MKSIRSKFTNDFSNTGSSAVFLAAIALSVIHAQAGVVITPNGQSATEGNSNNGYPFNVSDFSTYIPSGTQRFQQVYSATEFASLAGGGEWITQISFRPDGGGAAFSTTLPAIRIDLSTCAAGPDGLSSTFANNVGMDDTIVYGGLAGAPLSLSSSSTGSGPKNFDITIVLTTPFFYNPAAGNLLLDVRNFGGGRTTQFDSQLTFGDSVSRVFTIGSGVGSASADGNDSEGLVTRFITVPEPGVMAFTVVGFLGFLFKCHRNSGTNNKH